MNKVTAKQIWLSVLVTALFAPVYLSAGSEAFRPALYGLPLGIGSLFVWLVVGLMVVFVVMVWWLAASAFSDEEGDR